MNDYVITSYGYSPWWGMTTEDIASWLKEQFLRFTLDKYCREKAAPVKRDVPVVDKREQIKALRKSFQ